MDTNVIVIREFSYEAYRRWEAVQTLNSGDGKRLFYPILMLNFKIISYGIKSRKMCSRKFRCTSN